MTREEAIQKRDIIVTQIINELGVTIETNTKPLIRCVECRYKGMEICPMYKLTKAGVLKPYDFCSYGERSSE